MEIASSPKTTHIPNDVMVEILSRAPANSLMRFRWACKHWFDLIRDPMFIKLHLLHHSTTSNHHRIIDNTSFLMPTRSQVVHSISCRDILNQSSSFPTTVKIDSYNLVPISYCYRELKVLGSCNGLIYFHQLSTFKHCVPNTLSYFIWNPSTGELKELPQPSIDPNMLPSIDPNVLFELYSFHGFGYDHNIDDYKVVRITYCTYNFELINEVEGVGEYISKAIHVYTLGSNSWRTIENNIVDSDDFLHYKSGLYVNGALHWLKKKKLVTFHIAKEENQEIQLPNSVSKSVSSSWLSYLSELNGCLCIFYMNDFKKRLVDVWMMKVYGVKESWTKLFTIDMTVSRMDSLELPQALSNSLIYYNKDGETLMVCDGKHVFVYDPRKKKTRYDHNIEECHYYDHNIRDYYYKDGFVVASYIGSLVSLNSGKYLTAAGSRTMTARIPEGCERRKITFEVENMKMKKQKSCSSTS